MTLRRRLERIEQDRACLAGIQYVVSDQPIEEEDIASEWARRFPGEPFPRGRVVYLMRREPLTAEEWAARYCEAQS